MPNYTLLDSTTATSIFTSAFGFISANFAGVAVLLGLILGLKFGARLINGARHGKVKV